MKRPTFMVRYYSLWYLNLPSRRKVAGGGLQKEERGLRHCVVQFIRVCNIVSTDSYNLCIYQQRTWVPQSGAYLLSHLYKGAHRGMILGVEVGRLRRKLQRCAQAYKVVFRCPDHITSSSQRPPVNHDSRLEDASVRRV